VQSGDAVFYSLSTYLAVSPETSMRFGFSQTFNSEDSFNGDDIKGSDTTSVSFEAGVSVILNSRTLLDIGGSIGLNDDANDYALRVSLPIRFDLPIPF
jgi:hypothetical protein